MQLFGKQIATSLVILFIGTCANAEEPATDEPATAQAVEKVAQDQPGNEPSASESPGSETVSSQPAECEQRAAAPKPPKLLHGAFRFRTYPAAWTAAQKTNRPILIYVTSQGCPHCVKMVEKTYCCHPVTELVADSFETVYVERHLQPKLVEKLQIKWYPTTILVSPNNQVIDKIEGYVEHKTFSQRLQVRLTALAAANSLATADVSPRK